ncbi:MAG: MFS transporter [Gammaproteobacteria bacterium]|nr:MFS transporter [Gammaproteobacteria bacterium]
MRQVPERCTFRQILPFFSVIIIDVMSFGIIIPVLAPLVTKTTSGFFAHYDTVIARHLFYGLVSSLTPLCYILGGPLMGYFSDHMGRKKGLLLCSVGSLIGLICYSLSLAFSSLALLLAGRAIIGITMGGQAVAQSAMADISRGNQKVSNIGLIAVAMTIGLVLGPLLGGILSDSHLFSGFSNTTPFYVAIALALINLVIVNTMLKTPPTKNRPQHYHLFAQLKQFSRHTPLRIILIIFLFFELGWSLYFQALPLLLVQTFHFSNSRVGLFSAYVGLSLSLGLIFLVRTAANYCSLSRMINYGLIIGIFALSAAFFCHNQLSQWLLAIPITLSVALCYAALVTLASDHIAADKQGLLMGTTDALIAIAFAITGLLAGILTTTHPQRPELLAALFNGMAIVISLVYSKQLQSPNIKIEVDHNTATMIPLTTQSDNQ